MRVIERDGIDGLLGALRRRGYRTVGPVLRDAAIVYDEISRSADLPAGWTDDQDGGTYRVERRYDEALFGYAVGPHILEALPASAGADAVQGAPRRGRAGLEMRGARGEAPRYAFIGVRSCDLHAIAIQDRVMIEGAHPDPALRSRREGAFIVAVNCGEAGGTCFCVSMETGPRADVGLRPCAHRGHRGWPPPLHGRGRQRARRGGARRYRQQRRRAG